MRPSNNPETNFKISRTKDGSDTVRRIDWNVTYHSIFGALQESQHVFIHNGLDYYSNSFPGKSIRILELGFGTGLNALLALDYSINHKISIEYTALEVHPLPVSLLHQLNYPELASIGEEARKFFLRLHLSDTHQMINDYFLLKKYTMPIQELNPDNFFDLIFYDAFDYGAQQELWSIELFQKIHSWMNKSAVLVTYAAKGVIKRNLKQAGFQVSTVQGPPGKREMIRAIK